MCRIIVSSQEPTSARACNTQEQVQTISLIKEIDALCTG